MYDFALGEALEHSTMPDSHLCSVNGIKITGNREVMIRASNRLKRLDRDDVTVLYAIAAGALMEIDLGPHETMLGFADIMEQLQDIAADLGFLIEKRDELEVEISNAA